MTTEKFCTKCGRKFIAIGRQVICPSCKAAAEEETKRAAVERAKRASWTGESVPVRISGRASTVIREYGAANNMPFAAALDALLQSTSYFAELGVEWNTIQPYKSRRRDKHTTETAQDVQEVKQEEVKTAASKPQDVPQAAKQAAKQTSKATASKTKAASKPQASKPQEVKQDEPAKPVKAKTVKK